MASKQCKAIATDGRRWIECDWCGLRLGYYYPGIAAAARHRDNTPAHIVSEALNLEKILTQEGSWDGLDK